MRPPLNPTIAARMGVETRTVQRSLKKLTDLGLLTRVTEKDDAGEERVVCDLSRLIGRLEQYVLSDPDYQVRKYQQSADLVEEAAP